MSFQIVQRNILLAGRDRGEKMSNANPFLARLGQEVVQRNQQKQSTHVLHHAPMLLAADSLARLK